MSIVSDLLEFAKVRELEKIRNPRVVQTIKQEQVPLDNNAIAQQASAKKSAPALNGFLSKIPGGRNAVFAVGGLLLAGIIYKKVF
jgi:hypothetical protein